LRPLLTIAYRYTVFKCIDEERRFVTSNQPTAYAYWQDFSALRWRCPPIFLNQECSRMRSRPMLVHLRFF